MKRAISLVVATLICIASIPAVAVSNSVDIEGAQAYYDILEQKKVDAIYSDNFFYADLIDFNGDNISELYIIYGTDNTHYNEEIYTYKNNQAKKIKDELYSVGGTGYSHDLYFLEKGSKTYIMRYSEISYGDGKAPYYNQHYTSSVYSEIKEDSYNTESLLKVESYYFEDDKGPTRYEYKEAKEGSLSKEITQSEYRNIKSKYEGSNKKQILVDNIGSVSLVEGLKSYKETLAELKEQKEQSASDRFENYGFKDTYPEKTDSEKGELIEYLNGFNIYYFASEFDVSKDYAKALQFLLYGSDDFQKEPSYIDSNWCKISAESIDKQLYEVFGLTANHAFKGGDMLYKDGYYHYFEGGAGSLPSSTQPNAVYQIDSNLYYVDFKIYGYLHEHDVNPNQPKEFWNIDYDDCVVDHTGYAIIRSTHVGYQLLEYSREDARLSPEELKLYENIVFNDVVRHWGRSYIENLSDKKIINGYQDGTFRPDSFISRGEAAQILSNYVGGSESAEAPFDSTGRWSTPAIQNLIGQGIVKGYKDGSFKPDRNISKAEFATMLYNAMALEGLLHSPSKTFGDISGHWAEVAVEALAGNGIVKGYDDGMFRPDNNITRAEAATMIYMGSRQHFRQNSR